MKTAFRLGVISSLLALSLFLYMIQRNSTEEVIMYFPLDQDVHFLSYSTKLLFDSQKGDDEYEITWRVHSETDTPAYLRQDVSLLYVNGQLKGVMNKWQEQAARIEKETVVHGEETKKYEAISFHHGEIHKEQQPIKSVQAISKDTLYVVDSPHSQKSSFHSPTTSLEREWKEKLDHSIRQQVEAQWDELLDYYQIPRNEYILIPLTELDQFGTKPLPGTSKEESGRIMGQLWEGLYRNYILGISNQPSSHPIQSYIPIILFDKNGKHLLVLFEDDTGKKHQLIQHY